MFLPGLTVGFRINNRRRYPWIFLALCLVALAAAYLGGVRDIKTEWVISVLGVAVGFTTLMFTQHLQETRLFSELFKEFNARYDQLNNQLNKIKESANAGIHGDDRQVLMDYFNLCGEEYLYFNAGYIDATAWSAWREGMKFYAGAPQIRQFWQEELERGSYYGFSLRELEKS